MNKVTVTVDNDALVKSSSGKRSLRKWFTSPRRSSRMHSPNKHGDFKGVKTINIVDTSEDLSLAPTDVSNSTAFQQPHQDSSPQEHLNAILTSRGYSTRTYPALGSGYFNKPTKLQLASYSGHIMTVIRKDDAKAQETLRKLLSSGISTNPCEMSGESVLHAVCRRGNHKLARIMLEEHAEQTTVGDAVDMVQISDDFGRTPLTAACWSTSTPSFETVQLLLDHDLHLLQLVDARGATPLSYVPPEQWPAWIDFLNEVADHYWPKKDEEQRQQKEQAPPLTLVAPNSRRFPNPANALMLELASLVAAGKMNRAEVECLKYDTEAIMDAISSHSKSKLGDFSDSSKSCKLDFSASCLDDINNSGDDNNNNSFLSHEDSSCSSFSWDQADMADLLEGLSG
jgi:Ankyrin repeats (3 copies)